VNQVYRITVGQGTLLGRLPAVRVGVGFCCRFEVYGVSHATGTVPPKIWITTADDTLYWVGVWDTRLGAWIVEVNTDATEEVASRKYALTVFGTAEDKEYFVGESSFEVIATIAGTGATGGVSGQSVSVRLTQIEDWIGAFADIGDFDPENATDFEMREHVKAIGDKLKEAL